MWEAAIGDTIFHYTDGFIVGISSVLEPAHAAPNPYPNNDMWTKSGKKIAVNFTPLAKPIAKTKIPLNVRTAATGKNGPFNMNGDVQQGYFFPLSDDVAQTILNLK